MSWQYLDLGDVSARLAVCEATVRRLIATGDLKAIKFRRNIRVSQESLNAFVEENGLKTEDEATSANEVRDFLIRGYKDE